MPKPTPSTLVCAGLWTTAVAWILLRSGGPGDVDRLLLAGAIAATIFAAVDRHANQLAEIAGLAFRAGVASSYGRNSRVTAGDLRADDRERPRG